MNNKQIVEDLLQRIPEEVSLEEIAREIEFVAAVAYSQRRRFSKKLTS